MAVYAVIDVSVKNMEKLKQYVAGHLPTIEQYGGRIISRGLEPLVITGNWSPKLLVIHEWPSVKHFHAWYDSEEYRPWKELRKDACDMNLVLTEDNPGEN